ncbi:hypothetical protein KC348_g86 [Hortaea werneckii]|nr:hypothetical protein KC348_g86 [Hortaea werneckii]
MWFLAIFNSNRMIACPITVRNVQYSACCVNCLACCNTVPQLLRRCAQVACLGSERKLLPIPSRACPHVKPASQPLISPVGPSTPFAPLGVGFFSARETFSSTVQDEGLQGPLEKLEKGCGTSTQSTTFGTFGVNVNDSTLALASDKISRSSRRLGFGEIVRWSISNGALIDNCVKRRKQGLPFVLSSTSKTGSDHIRLHGDAHPRPPKPSQALAYSNQEGNWTFANGDTDMETNACASYGRSPMEAVGGGRCLYCTCMRRSLPQTLEAEPAPASREPIIATEGG